MHKPVLVFLGQVHPGEGSRWEEKRSIRSFQPRCRDKARLSKIHLYISLSSHLKKEVNLWVQRFEFIIFSLHAEVLEVTETAKPAQ